MHVLGLAIVQILLCARNSTGNDQPTRSTRRMIKGSVYIACTLDGFIATRDGAVDFLDQYHSPTPVKEEDDEGSLTEQAAVDMGFAAFLESVDVIIMGRKSFEKVLSFGAEMWPYRKTQIVVWTRNEDNVKIPDFCRETVTCTSLVPAELMKFLEENGHEHAYIDGGTTIREFLREDQINELILTIVPLILGEGIPLFGNLGRRIPLDHVKTTPYPNGLVMTKYLVKK